MVPNRKVTNMKKKFALVLCVLAMVFMLGACGKDPKEVDYNGVSYDELEKTALDMAEGIDEMYQQIVILAQEENESVDDILVEIKKETSGSFPNYVYEGVERWHETVGEIGAYKSVDESSFAIEKSGKTLTSSVTLQYEDRTATFQVVYTYYNMEISSIVINPDYTLGEKLGKAGMNTLISMSIVFSVLILISLIIACFKIFPYLEKKKATRKSAETKDQVVTQIEQREEQQVEDDTEIIAVIAAAIAASTGQSTSDFVVRSINRR